MQLRLVILLGLCVISSSAHADNLQTFTFNGSLSDGYVEQGSIVIDTTIGQFELSNFTFTNGPSVFHFNYPYGQEPFSPLETFVQFPAGLDPASQLYADLFFLLPVGSLVGYQGGSICSDQAPCPDGYSSGAYLIDTDYNTVGVIDIVSGSLTPTPEPSAIVLLGTGLLTAVGVVRRRFALAHS